MLTRKLARWCWANTFIKGESIYEPVVSADWIRELHIQHSFLETVPRPKGGKKGKSKCPRWPGRNGNVRSCWNTVTGAGGVCDQMESTCPPKGIMTQQAENTWEMWPSWTRGLLLGHLCTDTNYPKKSASGKKRQVFIKVIFGSQPFKSHHSLVAVGCPFTMADFSCVQCIIHRDQIELCSLC